MKKTLIYLALIALIINTTSIESYAHEDGDIHSALFKTIAVKDNSLLDITDCVAIAFKNSPKIKRKKYELDVAKSNVGLARSAFFPVIGAGVGYNNAYNSDKNVYMRHYRELPNVAITVNQLVWDFGKSTANIKMEEFYKIGAEYEFMDSLCMTLFDIKDKYYEVLKAQASLEVAEDNVKICRKYLKIAKGKPDKTTASVYLSKALLELSYAQTQLKNAKVNLSNAMFLSGNPDYKIKNTKTFTYSHDYGYEDQKIPERFVPYNFEFTRDKAIDIAYENSPDLRVLEATKGAMEQSLKYVKRTYFPELTAGAGYGYLNSSETSNNSLAIGINLSSSVNLMELKHSIGGADAQLRIADNEIDHFKKDLYFEVQRAFNNTDFAAEDVPYAQDTAVKALENLNLVEKLYNEGVLNYTSLQDARKDYITALQNYVKSLTFYNKSLIEVEEVLHYHLVDIHHKTQHALSSHADELIEHLNEALDCEGTEKKSRKIKKSKTKTNL